MPGECAAALSSNCVCPLVCCPQFNTRNNPMAKISRKALPPRMLMYCDTYRLLAAAWQPDCLWLTEHEGLRFDSCGPRTAALRSACNHTGSDAKADTGTPGTGKMLKGYSPLINGRRAPPSPGLWVLGASGGAMLQMSGPGANASVVIRNQGVCIERELAC